MTFARVVSDPTHDRMIADAMVMAGLQPAQLAAIQAGSAVYGEDGQLDSLGLVRLIGALGSTLEDRGIDLFDLMQRLDLEATEAFANLASIRVFLAEVLSPSTVAGA